jgi:uncharacterized membrane protein
LFLERGMFQTGRRTGILVLIGLFEREAAILADSGVREQVSDGQIEAVIGQMTPLVRRGLVVEAAQSALTALTRLLRGKLEPAIGANELAEALVQERGS